MKINNELIEHLLAYDVITEAEKITMHKYKEHNLTQRLAALNFVKKNQKLAKELKANQDTYRSMRYLDFINTVMFEGFRPVYNESFSAKDYGGKSVTEVLLAFYHEAKGILLVAESFGGTMINSAEMYYNWVPNQMDSEWIRAISSGEFEKTKVVWAGKHDIKEALKYKMDLLHRKGFFTPQWVKRPHVWLVNYVEANTTKEYEKINQKKMSTFPEAVRKAILA